MSHPKKVTKPFVKFIKTQRRSLNLTKLFLSLQESKEIPSNTDLLRSAIVLSVASMDAYFTDKFSDLVVPRMKNKGVGESLERLLKEAGLDLRQTLSLLTMQRPYRRIRSLVATHLETKTTQSLKAIDELFLCFGINNFCACVEGRLGRRNLLDRIRRLVEHRHKIVHDGDYTRQHKLRSVEFHKTTLYLNEVLTFVDEAENFLNEVFNN